jgi:UDP-glucose/iron transport system ATP-binding protein
MAAAQCFSVVSATNPLSTQPANLPIVEATNAGRIDETTGAWLLRDASLTIRAGDRIGLVGPNGAGKTLLLRALARLDPLTEGRILWRGEEVRGGRVPAFRSQIMYLHQRPVVVEGTVDDNLRLPFALRQHAHRRYQPKRVLAWLAQLGREESFLVKRNETLSGGEAQMVGLLRAMELDPNVLLLDEPTAALDGGAAAWVEALIASWHADQPGERALVWVSHNPQQTERMCDRVFEMKEGRLLSLRGGPSVAR